MGKAPPPAPQSTAPRPNSPIGPPPKLPSRSNSTTTLSLEETPEEKERKHRLNKRRRVIQELQETEISYSKDLLLLQEVYVSDMTNSPLFTQADEKIIFMNLGEIIELSLDFVALLTPACGGGPDVVYDDAATFVGEAFLQMLSRIRRVYSEYCKKQEASGQHLQELEGRKDIKPFFEACKERCQGRTTTWDLSSFLIKPVQRVLKYPLLINQIHALTPPEHLDFESIATVQKDMLQVAEEINEIKKRKDIVEKIVGPKKKNDSDLRQAVGGSDVTVDILFEALLEKFNLQQALAREFARYILVWLVSIKQYFDSQEALALTLREVYSMVPIHRSSENQSILMVSEFHKSLSQFSKTIGRELEARLKKTVYKSIESFLKLFLGPLQVMKKREKKLLDYDSVRGMKERGETVDKNMLDSAEAYTAINEQLLDELPKFLGLTTRYFDLIVMEFSKVQMFFYDQVKGKILEFFVKNMSDSLSGDEASYLATMDVCEEYIVAMSRVEGPLIRLQKISLIKNVASAHETAFRNMREASQRRKRSASISLHSRSRNASTASRSPMLTPSIEKTSWHSNSPTELLPRLPIQSRFFPGEDENPFEIPESIFHDGSVTSDDYEPFGNSYDRNAFGSGDGKRPLSGTSFNSGSGSGEYQDYSTSKPPAMDEGTDTDEIGIAQALFECTAIYPYSSSEERQLSFVAGESIVVFGLNEDGWYFGKKKIANVLLRKGRMPVSQIANITSIKPRQVRESLFVMIQHNIAVYAESQERSRIVTYYEINRPELLHRTIIPKLLYSAQKWFERDGGLVTHTVLKHGILTIEECIKDILVTHSTSSSAPATKTPKKRTDSIRKAFIEMVKQKCLIAVRPTDSMSVADKDMADEKRETDKMALPPTAAELAIIRKTLGAQKMQQEQTGTIVGLKRTLESLDHDALESKRHKLTDGDLVIKEEVDTDVLFKINYERFIIRWRNAQIASLYEVRLNPTAKAIINTTLELAEERMINCKEDYTIPINLMLVLNNLPKDINLVDTLEFDPAELGTSNIKPKPGECLEKYMEVLEDDLMRILKRDAGRSGQYIIHLRAAAKILKRNLIQDIVSSRFGMPYVRIMNMLLDKGKLEEKQISRFSMMPVKDVREKLTTLCTFGVLNLQEVPKTNDRTPSRTFYLWEVLLDRAADSLVNRLYHTMANLRQRRFVEKAKRAVLLEKCERTDVLADDNLLNAAEKRELDTLAAVLELLENQELRVAEMAMTLKEF
ncbi:hypothetical protein BGZ65_001776 [Modicella reniformis]|uniref:Dynamin-binding protein n=1 Tax=Modicella reniformis TaxID=1440133 RepID=A0A9P6J1Y0_9FUNG|nr:hypothetical protein BGZ65_001776 [Modicella reniformis]